MKKLSEVVNVVPVIAKSDSLTIEERDNFKIKVCGIPIVEILANLGRFGRSWCITIFVFILSIRMRMKTRRFS
jgi:hypothetical protein